MCESALRGLSPAVVGVKGCSCLPLCCADCLNSEPQPPGVIRDCTGLYRDCITFYLCQKSEYLRDVGEEKMVVIYLNVDLLFGAEEKLGKIKETFMLWIL